MTVGNCVGLRVGCRGKLTDGYYLGGRRVGNVGTMTCWLRCRGGTGVVSGGWTGLNLKGSERDLCSDGWRLALERDWDGDGRLLREGLVWRQLATGVEDGRGR